MQVKKFIKNMEFEGYTWDSISLLYARFLLCPNISDFMSYVWGNFRPQGILPKLLLWRLFFLEV